MKSIIKDALIEIGDQSNIKGIEPVTGGEISRTFQVKTKENNYFVKINLDAPEDFFEKEATGLQMIKETKTISVPDVFYYSSSDSRLKGILVMEWVEGSVTRTTEEELGRQIALLHQSYGKSFGLDTDTYIGNIKQTNGWFENWSTFFMEKRLLAQAYFADKKGILGRERKSKLEWLYEHLDQWIDTKQVKPSLLHGDLWGGNWIAGAKGKPYVIDPSVFYGDFEFELAFTEMFGGFSSKFYDSYKEVNPISEGYEDRKLIYQLYYYLVHLNHFGEAYGPHIDRILKYYVL